MPHPSKYKASTGQCWECGSYSIEIPGGAFCKQHKTFFPNQSGWAVEGEEGTKAGERTCKFWKVKTIKIKKFKKKQLFVRDIMKRMSEKSLID